MDKSVLDEDLIELMHMGNSKASEELFKRYDKYSWRIAFEFNYAHPKSGIGVSDYHQVAFSSTIKAVKKFENDHSSTFYVFWKKIADNEILRYYLENSYQAGASYFSGISLNDVIDDGFELSDYIGSEDKGIHEIIVRKELDIYIQEVKDSFREVEDSKIVDLFLDNLTIDQIIKATNSNYRHVTYVISRFQKLMSKILQKRNYN